MKRGKIKVDTLDNRTILTAPSVLAADFAKLGEEIARVEQAGCQLLHLDVMDGHFVPNLTIGPPLVASVRKISNLIFDTHLMITDPAKYAPVFADAGSDHITFHTECADDPAKVIELIHKLGCSAGISLKPATPVSAVLPWIDMIELVLVMTVEPGFGGQSFMADMMPKVRLIRDEITKRKLKTHVEVDGGIDGKTAVTAAENGANMMVAGTSVFRNPSGARAAVESIVAVQKHLR